MQTFVVEKPSSHAKRYNHPLLTRVKHDPVAYAKALLSKHTQANAHKLAQNQVDGLNKTITDGAPADWTSGKAIRRDLGFWKSVAGFLSRYPKKLEK